MYIYEIVFLIITFQTAAESVSYLTLFFFYNKLANSTFNHDFFAKQDLVNLQDKLLSLYKGHRG